MTSHQVSTDHSYMYYSILYEPYRVKLYIVYTHTHTHTHTHAYIHTHIHTHTHTPHMYATAFFAI